MDPITIGEPIGAPRAITAAFPGNCQTCGVAYAVGARIVKGERRIARRSAYSHEACVNPQATLDAPRPSPHSWAEQARAARDNRERQRESWDRWIEVEAEDDARAAYVEDAVLGAWRAPGVTVGETRRVTSWSPTGEPVIETGYRVPIVPGLTPIEAEDAFKRVVVPIVDVDARLAGFQAMRDGTYSVVIAVPDRW